MKISQFFLSLQNSDTRYLSILERGGFYILLREDAFFFAKRYSFKLTKLDSSSIKVWFPKTVKQKWLKKLRGDAISYKVYRKHGESFSLEESYLWSVEIRYDIEDYLLTCSRILEGQRDMKQEKTHNFLLKDKCEELFQLLQEILLRLPKKERYFIREKIERNFLELLETVYRYMYEKHKRPILAWELMSQTLVLREYTRFLSQSGRLKSDAVYLYLWERFTEILKIIKDLQR